LEGLISRSCTDYCHHDLKVIGQAALLQQARNNGVTGSSRESTTGTQDRSTDISIHLSPAQRGEPDSLGADLVAPTIRLHHSPKQQNLPDAYHKQVQGPRGTRQPYSGPQQPYSTYRGTMRTQTRLLYRIRLLSTGFVCSPSHSSSFAISRRSIVLGSFQRLPLSSPYSSPYK
jgi:hypothetical protein